MINLMPDEAKKQLRAARTNVVLTRYTFILLIGGVLLGLAFFGSYLLLAQTRTSAEQLITANDTKAEVFSDTRQKIASLTANLGEARNVLDQQVSYSNVLRVLGQQMTAGTVIDEITLNEASFRGTPITLTLYATSTDATVRLGDQLQMSGIFTSIAIESVSEQGGIEGYPFSASMTMTVAGGTR